MKSIFFTIPTLLTWARIVAIPLVVLIYYTNWDTRTQNITATVLFIAVALTDWLDGYLARKLGQSSAFGAFLDPVADKFLVCASLLILLQLGRIDVLVALVIIGREIAVSALREWMAQIGASKSVAVHMVGKLKTTAQLVAIPFLFYNDLFLGFIPTPQVGYWLLWLAALLTVWSMAYYLQKAIPEIRQRVKAE